jgi:hypothetical protein
MIRSELSGEALPEAVALPEPEVLCGEKLCDEFIVFLHCLTLIVLDADYVVSACVGRDVGQLCGY